MSLTRKPLPFFIRLISQLAELFKPQKTEIFFLWERIIFLTYLLDSSDSCTICFLDGK